MLYVWMLLLSLSFSAFTFRNNNCTLYRLNCFSTFFVFFSFIYFFKLWKYTSMCVSFELYLRHLYPEVIRLRFFFFSSSFALLFFLLNLSKIFFLTTCFLRYFFFNYYYYFLFFLIKFIYICFLMLVDAFGVILDKISSTF